MSNLRTRKSKHGTYNSQTIKPKKKKNNLIPESKCPYCGEKYDWVLKVNERGKAKMVCECRCS